VATVIGKKKNFIQNEVIPGDVLIMTKSAGLEGSSIIASDYEDRIKNILNKNQIEFLKNLINELSVIPEGRIASLHNAKYKHDITEGGVLGAAWEISKLAGCNIELHCDEIFIYAR
jgi:hydrogenase maturation factor